MSRVHALIIGHLKAQMPFFGQAAAQKKMIDNMSDEFYAVMKKHRLPQGDFPNITRFAEIAATYDFSKFRKTDDKMLSLADDALSGGIPQLLTQLGQEQDARAEKEKELHSSFMDSGVASAVSVRADAGAARMGGGMSGPVSAGGIGSVAERGGESHSSSSNPFGSGGSAPTSNAYTVWATLVDKVESDGVMKLQPGGMEGKLSGADARAVLMESGLEVNQLRAIWDLADIDKDGFLDRDEYVLFILLILLLFCVFVYILFPFFFFF
jgi:Domain of unknown function (DUF5600)/Cytoskeletal-regulatory complex EF hand